MPIETSIHTANETVLRVYVEEDGIYQITGDYLQNAGINIRSIDPKNIKLTNSHNSVPIWVIGDRDGSFDPEDAIIFKGEFNRGAESYYSPYTPENVYWLTFNGDPGVRIIEVDAGIYESNPTTVPVASCSKHFEEDDVFERLLLVNDETVDHWFWSKMQPGIDGTHDINIDDPVYSTEKAKLRLELRGLTHHSYANPDHHVLVKLNGYFLSRQLAVIGRDLIILIWNKIHPLVTPIYN